MSFFHLYVVCPEIFVHMVFRPIEFNLVDRFLILLWLKTSPHFNSMSEISCLNTSIFDKVLRTFTRLVHWRHGVPRDCKWSNHDIESVSLTRPSKSKQHRTENNKLWLSTCCQLIKPWLLKIQQGEPCHTLAKLDVVIPFQLSKLWNICVQIWILPLW